MRGDKIDKAFSTNEREINVYVLLVRNLEETKSLETCVDVGIIIKCMLKRKYKMVCSGFSWLRIEEQWGVGCREQWII
jgi:hypothetical protein